MPSESSRFTLDNLSREDLEELVRGLDWAENESGERNLERCRALRARLEAMLGTEGHP